MPWLLDTNVLSELRRPRPEAKVVAFVAGCPLDSLYISSVTLAEIRFGIALVAEPGRRVELHAWLAQKVRPMFENRILQVTEDNMFRWRLVVEEATAIEHNLTVVTRDRSDYDKAGAAVINPWKE